MQVVYSEHPVVEVGTNKFVNCPVILQYNDIPLLEVGKFVDAGYTIRFPVYNESGIKIGKVVGSQFYPTEEAEQARIQVRHEPNLTAFHLDGKPILELHRKGAAALHGWAELYAPGGVLIRATTEHAYELLRNDSPLKIRSVLFQDNTFDGVKIGIKYTDDSIHVGIS